MLCEDLGVKTSEVSVCGCGLGFSVGAMIWCQMGAGGRSPSFHSKGDGLADVDLCMWECV